MADRDGRDRFDRQGNESPVGPSQPQRGPLPSAPTNMGDGGPLIKVPAPCGKHEVYYPQALKILAERRIRFYVFQTVCGCGTAYLATTLPDGPRFWFGGDPQSIGEVYDRIPWPEHRYGLVVCKLAPSLDALITYFAADPA